MNHLAHALLAGPDDELRFGGLLADFVRGTPDPSLSPGIVAGIRLHRAIDSYTDQHPAVVAARALLPPPYRRYAGIALDMWFDHALARDFGRWSPQPLTDFSAALRELLLQHDSQLPPSMQRFRRYMDAHELPAAYAEPAMLGLALEGIGQRLSRANPLDTVLPLLVALDAPLQAQFEAFFPQLRDFADGWIAERTP
jgi:acyl carrier protein phosphodiesterase